MWATLALILVIVIGVICTELEFRADIKRYRENEKKWEKVKVYPIRNGVIILEPIYISRCLIDACVK